MSVAIALRSKSKVSYLRITTSSLTNFGHPPKSHRQVMMDQLMLDLMNLDVLDLSFDADEHEMLDSCYSGLPGLLEESFTASADTRHGRDEDDDDNNNNNNSEAAGDERMDVEGDGDDDDSFTECDEWAECGDNNNNNNNDQPEGSSSSLGDIHWDPTPFLPTLESYHDCHDASCRSFREYETSSVLPDATVVVSQDTASPPSAVYGNQDIHWVPPPPPPAAATTNDSPRLSTTNNSNSERSLSSSSSATTRSLQEEYERSRQKLVVSMMRSQESCRYVRHQLQLQPSSSTSVGSMRDIMRSEMISTLSRPVSCNNGSAAHSMPGLYT
jgi:hypothetical protein